MSSVHDHPHHPIVHIHWNLLAIPCMNSVENQIIYHTHRRNVLVNDIYYRRKNRLLSVEPVRVVRSFVINLFNMLIIKLIIDINSRARLVCKKEENKRSGKPFDGGWKWKWRWTSVVFNLRTMKRMRENLTACKKGNSSDKVDVKIHWEKNAFSSLFFLFNKNLFPAKDFLLACWCTCTSSWFNICH